MISKRRQPFVCITDGLSFTTDQDYWPCRCAACNHISSSSVIKFGFNDFDTARVVGGYLMKTINGVRLSIVDCWQWRQRAHADPPSNARLILTVGRTFALQYVPRRRRRTLTPVEWELTEFFTSPHNHRKTLFSLADIPADKTKMRKFLQNLQPSSDGKENIARVGWTPQDTTWVNHGSIEWLHTRFRNLKTSLERISLDDFTWNNDQHN